MFIDLPISFCMSVEVTEICFITVLLQFQQAGKGGELTHDETTIIAGALELTEKKAKDAMTPLCQTFAIDINAKLDRYWLRYNYT